MNATVLPNSKGKTTKWYYGNYNYPDMTGKEIIVQNHTNLLFPRTMLLVSPPLSKEIGCNFYIECEDLKIQN